MTQLFLECLEERCEEDGINITGCEENPEGKDVVYFICPECHKEHSSYRYGR